MKYFGWSLTRALSHTKVLTIKDITNTYTNTKMLTITNITKNLKTGFDQVVHGHIVLDLVSGFGTFLV